MSFYGLGCNPFQGAKDKINEKIGESVAEGLLGKATGGKVDIKEDGGQVVFTDNKTGGSVAFGEDVKLPDDFPKNVPIYPGSKIGGVTVSKQNNPSAWVVLSSEDEVKKLVDWYADQTKSNGWKEESSLSLDKTEVRTYSKDNEKLGLNVMPSEDETKGKSSAIITWEQEVKADDSASE